jgi:hypothetical protein
LLLEHLLHLSTRIHIYDGHTPATCNSKQKVLHQILHLIALRDLLFINWGGPRTTTMGPYDLARNLIPDGEDSMMDSTFSTASEQTPHAKSLPGAVPGRQPGALSEISKMRMGHNPRDEGRARQPSRKFTILRPLNGSRTLTSCFLLHRPIRRGLGS